MYRAKTTGKSRFKVFSNKLFKMTRDALQLENDLKKALERNEFVLHYQPIICPRTEKIKGFEALIRWEHPTRGMISPHDFIPVAEEMGLIIPIGQWVIETACCQLKDWQTQIGGAQKLNVSVNVSVVQFIHNNLEEIVETALKSVDLSPHFLTVELTESAVIERPESIIGHLNRLKEIGVRIAIDDFGTGYFSLVSLKHFPLDFLKMDKSFVDEINASQAEGLIKNGFARKKARSLNG
jgi:EAL domain-containing protein (putative c-di-GMP-specific phosphodiesterase class I)